MALSLHAPLSSRRPSVAAWGDIMFERVAAEAIAGRKAPGVSSDVLLMMRALVFECLRYGGQLQAEVFGKDLRIRFGG